MLVVGLTGGIATGKSTVSKRLQATHNLPVVDADIIARQVVDPGTQGFHKVVATFGPDILTEDGTIDRPKLGKIIFNDNDKRKQLNSIIHPAVRRAMLLAIIKHWIRGSPICIVDVPLLIETGLYKWMGYVVVVACSSETQLHRLMQRDQSTSEDATSRLKSQMPIEDKVAYANAILNNSGTLEELSAQVDLLVEHLRRAAGWSWRVSWILPPIGLLSAVLTLVHRAFKRRQGSTKKED